MAPGRPLLEARRDPPGSREDLVLRLAHVSDLHVQAPWPRAPWHYLGKRAIGAFNYRFRRAHQYPRAAAEALVRSLAEDPTIDHVAITGDLTNVSFPGEFSAVRELLAPLLRRPGFVSAIPGNHDRYTRRSPGEFERVFADCMTSELEDLGGSFPFVRFRGEVAIIGLDSGVPSAPFLAIGRLGDEQRARFAKALDHPRVRAASFRVALVHHPPLVAGGGRDKPHHRLVDDRELLDLATKGGVDLLLHGHVHDSFEVTSGRLRGIGVGSSTRVLREDPERSGRIHVYTIEAGALVATEVRRFDVAAGTYRGS